MLELVRAGLSNRQIAEHLCIEDKTVKNHINSIYSKLRIRTRHEARALGTNGRGIAAPTGMAPSGHHGFSSIAWVPEGW